MTTFVDSDVLIETLRGSPAAKAWFDSVTTEQFEVPGIVAMEIVAGCRTGVELAACRTFLAKFALAWPDVAESSLALELLASHRLRDGIGVPDCLIAAMALNRNAILFSFNLRHFRAVPGLNCKAPYDRD